MGDRTGDRRKKHTGNRNIGRNGDGLLAKLLEYHHCLVWWGTAIFSFVVATVSILLVDC
jgi:hypothetical protein